MYSIDLCAWCWDDLLKALFKYLFKARRTSPSGRTGEPNPFASRIRVWAWENGYQVKSYGPLSRDVLDAYFGAPGQEEADRAWLEELDRKKAEAAKKDRRYVYPPQRPCAVCGATPVIARNWCWPHLQRFYRYGDPLADEPLRLRGLESPAGGYTCHAYSRRRVNRRQRHRRGFHHRRPVLLPGRHHSRGYRRPAKLVGCRRRRRLVLHCPRRHLPLACP